LNHHLISSHITPQPSRTTVGGRCQLYHFTFSVKPFSGLLYVCMVREPSLTRRCSAISRL